VSFIRKYSEIIKRSYIKAIAFRSEVFLWIVLDTLPMMVVLLVWASMYHNNTTFSGYDFSAILQYYFLVAIINGLTAAHFETWRVQEIRDGKIDYFLMRPYSYPLEILLREIGGKLFYMTFSLPFFAVTFLLISTLGSLSLPVIQPLSATIFLCLLVTTFATEFLIGRIIVYAGFWFEYSEGLEHFKWIVITLLSGWMIPTAMMPTWLGTLVESLPFKYMYSVPIGVLQNTRDLRVYDALYIGAFIAVLITINKLMWNKAQYRYSSAGG
jgi:ABC-2 type transport system permease protein